jgi:hypothetical protein
MMLHAFPFSSLMTDVRLVGECFLHTKELRKEPMNVKHVQLNEVNKHNDVYY